MQAPSTSPREQREEQIGKFATLLAALVVLMALLPALVGLGAAPPGGTYLGQQYAFDDHMVYSAWMRQAMDGHFFFDNRFTTDPQPAATVHIYFFLLGLIAKLIGIPLAMTLARAGFSFLFVILLSKLLLKLDLSVFTTKFALFIATFGGGFGWLAWERFGRVLASPRPDWYAATLHALLCGHAPIDVWQPEAFVFPAMLTNGLFMASLCLIVAVLNAVVESRNSWKLVLPGALCYALLMNIHSYDVLLVALIVSGLLLTQVCVKQATWVWVGRTALIGCGAIPPALWFIHVLRIDPVFQARAATETFSPTFPQLLFGILPAVALAAVALATTDLPLWRRLVSSVGVLALIGGLYAYGYGRDPGAYLLDPLAWGIILLGSFGILAALARPSLVWNLFWSWALLGLVAIYFPALFQRKLAMGLMVPWGIVGAFGLSTMLRRLDRERRNMIAAVALMCLSLSTVMWLRREILFIRLDVSSTTVHNVFLAADLTEIVKELDADHGRKVVLAMPGVAATSLDSPNEFVGPAIPDLNPILSGMTGAYTYAGHWSETPDYNLRRSRLTKFFLASTSDSERRALLAETGANYIVSPDPVTFKELPEPLADLSGYGYTVYASPRFRLIRLY